MMLLLLYFFFLKPLMQWQLGHLSLSCTLLMLLNIAALALGCYSFFSGYADMEALKRYRDTLSPFESAALGLSAFISCLGFLWWLVPFGAIRKMGVAETGFIWGATLYFIVFIAVVAASINKKKEKIAVNAVITNIAAAAVSSLFFFFSYALLLVALRNWHPSWIGAPYLAIICLSVFYLPLRFFLLLRPPLHKLEYVGFILSFGLLLWELFVWFN